MAANHTRLHTHIQNFRFEDLFIEELGWDRYRSRLEVPVDDYDVRLTAFAQKRGMVAFIVMVIPEGTIRRKIEQQVAKTYHENIIIYTDQQQQIWQWVRREPGRPLANRELRFHRGQSGESIAQILDRIKFSLDEEDDLTIVDVTSRVRAAFDVERVTKRFYDRFKRQHDAFLAFIDGIPDEDLQRWYASVMLNRIMFIYFVQRKGFLDGDPNYLRNRLARIAAGGEGVSFYLDFLCPLFFEGFAKKEHTPEVKRLLGDVPYLNGGLFLQHQIEELYGDAIHIENTAFEKLFEFFDEYQWHLDERPLKKDNEINPDVLGYIFEKYINQKQMGAYYTKEDITEYISKNTVIPFLFDEARKAVKIAFEGEHTVWDLLTENPDRYIYPAVRHGAELPLPQNIAAGLEDVSQRGDWNTPAPPEYGLPTEIWRETVARRRRYEEVRGKLERGEVRQINDLITLNLDIQQFAQDVIDYTDSPDVVRAFWKAINNVTVLDPTCGSGAFLFAALNILEPLYEACLERMEGFVAELERTGGGHPQRYSDFREVMERIDQHPNRRYFILKSIIVNNLFGVDIMEEAVEICKLRLFLKLVAQVDDKRRIEPLPDIDFNIRAGNTLVGFATKDSVWQAMTTDAKGNMKMVFGEEQAALDEIERKAQDIDRLFGLFRQQQTALGGEVRPEDKAELKQRLGELEDELNRLLAGQYGVDTTKSAQYDQWRKSHEPFHWFVEFYGVLKDGGFDVIIGNPPYVEYQKIKKVYQIRNYDTLKSGNLYAFVIERSLTLQKLRGYMGMIVPLSIICTDRTASLQEAMFRAGKTWYANYDTIPGRLFGKEVEQRLSVFIQQSNSTSSISTTTYRRFSNDQRDTLFHTIEYQDVTDFYQPGWIPRISTNIQKSIISRLDSDKLSKYEAKAVLSIYIHRIIGYYTKAFDFVPYFSNERDGKKKSEDYKEFLIITQYQKAALSLINSNLFYWYWHSHGDGFHCGYRDVWMFPISFADMNSAILKRLNELAYSLMNDLQQKSEIKVRIFKATGRAELQTFYVGKSKPIIDEIDRVLARHYGFTDEELDFIINYDIKYRMGDDLSGDEGDEG